MAKQILTIEEKESSFARTVIAAATSDNAERFIKFQQYEFSKIGFTHEIRVMLQVADFFKMQTVTINTVDYSKYGNFLKEVWNHAQAFDVQVNEHLMEGLTDSIKKQLGAYPGDEGATMGGGQY
jgi:hypothetical protein